MNRRSAIKAAIGTCAAVLFPWRYASAAKTDNVDQGERITRLLKAEGQCQHEARDRWATRENDAAIKTVTYRQWVERHGKTNVIDIWWDEQRPLDGGLYDCGLVCLSAETAASMDDKKLTKHLTEAFLVAISSGYVCQVGMFDQPTCKPVWIRKGQAVGLEYIGETANLAIF